MVSKVVNFMRSNWKTFKPDRSRNCEDTLLSQGNSTNGLKINETGDFEMVPNGPEPTKIPLGEGDQCCLATLVQYSTSDSNYKCSFDGKGTYFFENQDSSDEFNFNGSASFHFDIDY